MAPEPARLEFRAVTRRFDDGARGRIDAVRALSFSVAPGEVFVLTGPSGAGKSTVLALAAGLLLPTEGEVHFDGECLSRLREPFRAELRRTRVAVVLQGLALVPHMSALENALLPWLAQGDTAAAEQGVARWFERFGLSAFTGSTVERLSGGERQRVALVRALAASARLLVLDEPTAHLDAAHAKTLADALDAQRAEGASVLLATHDPRLLERYPDAPHLALDAAG